VSLWCGLGATGFGVMLLGVVALGVAAVLGFVQPA
jgi:hypothetical protein